MAWTAPRTWVAGETVTAALLNTHLRDDLKAIGDPWTAWTPTITADTGTFTTVSGSGRYIQAGKLVIWSLSITITTAGTAAAGVRFTLPVTARAASDYLGSGRENSVTGTMLTAIAATTSVGVANKYDGTTIIASGRTLNLSGTYEAA